MVLTHTTSSSVDSVRIMIHRITNNTMFLLAFKCYPIFNDNSEYNEEVSIEKYFVIYEKSNEINRTLKLVKSG